MTKQVEEYEYYKKRLKALGISIGTGILFLSLVVFVVDPFFHYHKPWFGLPIILEDAVYQSAGVAEQLEYTDVILGTSMTENFHTGWFDEELGWSTMKLSYSGARTNDLQAILEKIYAGDRQVDHIFMDINDYQLSEPAWTAYVERPEYLYDSKGWNDYRYLMNKDALAISMKRVLQAIDGTQDNIDTAYTWEAPELFGKEVIYKGYGPERENMFRQAEILTANPKEKEEIYEVCQDNLDNIVPFIESHPETEYIIFLPPYSLLYWESVCATGRLDEKLSMYQYAMEKLLQYNNVKLFYFQDEWEVISNLEHYRDSTHHTPEYNRYIFECVKKGDKLVTEESYQDYINNMRSIAENCDYDKFWREGKLEY